MFEGHWRYCASQNHFAIARVPRPRTEHFHILLLDGVYAKDVHGKPRFRRVKAPSGNELYTLVHTLSRRIARCLEKRGLLERDAENTWLILEEIEEDTLTQLHGASLTYRVVAGSQKGRKVFTLQTLPNRGDSEQVMGQAFRVAGFSGRAGVVAEAHQRACVVTRVVRPFQKSAWR